MGDGPISRRALLAGAGVAAGAGSLAPIVQARAAGAGLAGPVQKGVAGPGPVPVVEGGQATADATTSALVVHRSLRLSGFDFGPDHFSDGRFVSASGTFTDVANGNTEALVRLPAGAKPTSVQWKVLNTTGTTTVAMYQLSWPLISLASVGFSIVGPSAAGLQTINTTISATPIDPNLYIVRMPTLTNGTRALYTAELFYDDPNVSLRLLQKQVRKLDTRRAGPLHGKFAPGQTRKLTLAPEVPAGAAAALVNLTVTNTVGVGFLTLFPAGTPNPGTSSINWSSSGQTLANSATVAVSAATQSIFIFCNGFGAADVIVDLVGYYA
jgi:hypothetical protein